MRPVEEHSWSTAGAVHRRLGSGGFRYIKTFSEQRKPAPRRKSTAREPSRLDAVNLDARTTIQDAVGMKLPF